MRGTTSIFCISLHICIMGLHPARDTDCIHVFIVEGVAVSEVNSTAADQKAYQVQRGGKGR
jgi:hypothetical protein